MSCKYFCDICGKEMCEKVACSGHKLADLLNSINIADCCKSCQDAIENGGFKAVIKSKLQELCQSADA